MKVLQSGLQYFICCAVAISIQAAFVPTSPAIIKQGRTSQLFSTKPSSPLSNLQDALPDLGIDKFNPLASSTESKVPAPPTPPPFDPTNPEALIAITKSFIATDFGIQSSQLPSYSTAQKKSQDDTEDTPLALPFYSSSLLSNDFIWISSNNLNDGRAGILNKDEYLAAGRYFNLRKSFPDLEYRAHDFRVVVDETKMYTDEGVGDSPIDEITVRFTTLAVGTFRGAPLRLRSKILEPNGKVMRCPPTSISITYATRGDNAGKIIKLVNDMVIDRGFGNTMGLSGIAGAAVIAGEGPSDWEVFPPLVSAGRIFARPIKMIQERDEDDGYLPPFPDSVMIQLAKGVTATNFALDDPDLLSEDFSYIEPLMGPMDKEKYLDVFEKFNVRDAVPDLDYQFQNYRIDPYDPYRVWIDTRARGTRTGPIGNSATSTPSKYLAPPESMSLTFDNDGFCTRMTAAAPLDPLLGNTGLLGGVYGLLYATETPENPLKTRTFNLLLNRAQKVALKAITKAGVDEYRLSDGRIISGSKPVAQLPAKSSANTSTRSIPTPPKLPLPPAQDAAPKSTPFFAAPKASNPTFSVEAPEPKQLQPRPKSATVALPKAISVKPTPVKALGTKPAPPKPEPSSTSPAKMKVISDDPQDPVTDAFSSFFGTSDVTGTPSTAKPSTLVTESVKTTSKVEELRQAAAAARKEAAEAKQRAAEQKALLEEKKTAPPPTPSVTVATQGTATAPKRSPTLNIFATPDTSSSSPEPTPKPKVSSSSTPAKKSPTFSIFGSTPSAPKGSAAKSQSQTTSQVPKKSPTLSIFGSALTSSDTAPAPTPQNRSPTLSLFGSGPKLSSTEANKLTKPVKKVTPKGTSKRTQTFSIAGVGGQVSLVAKKKSKSKVEPKKATVKKEVVKKAGVKKGTMKTPTFALFQGSSTSRGTPPAKKEMAKPAATKSSTFSLFGNTSNDNTPVEQEKPATKSPSTSLFGGIKSKPAAVKVAPTKPAPKQSAPVASAPKSQSSSGGSLFGDIFGGSSTTKREKQSNTTPSPKISPPTKVQPSAGIPTLKQWTVNPDNSIEALIYGSSSFRDGATVTTSPIGKKFKIVKGSVIQTSSGSKYLLS